MIGKNGGKIAVLKEKKKTGREETEGKDESRREPA